MMKNKLIYLISVLLVTVVSFSCSDDDDENNDKERCKYKIDPLCVKRHKRAQNRAQQSADDPV